MRAIQGEPLVRLARGAGKDLVVGGIPTLLSVAVAVAWPHPLTVALAAVLTTLLAFLAAFLRDPRRIPPAGTDLCLAPADGRVLEMCRLHEPTFVQGEALRISIFMSLLDVHVNRAPLAGRVVRVEHVPGQFHRAFRPESSALNEHNLIGLSTDHGKVLVKQVAGILARRIVCWVHPGQELHAGDRLGMIKLGSRVELYLPAAAEPVARVGDHTRAGVTVIARLN
jgi:phosphatidylserine decarboxylase